MTGADLSRFLAPMRRRVQGMVARAIVAAADDGSKLQALQITVLADEAHEGVERFQDYGFTSVPHAGAEAAVVFAGGVRSHGLVVAVADRRYRLTGLADGEVAVHDDQGQAVHLMRDRVRVVSPTRVEVEAPAIVLSTDALSLGGEGGKPVARVGDPVADGKISAGSAKVSAA